MITNELWALCPNITGREHEGLKGKTPAEACGIQVEGENKWLTLIQNSAKVEKK